MKPSLNELELLVGSDLADPAAQDAEAMALVRSGATRLVALTLARLSLLGRQNHPER